VASFPNTSVLIVHGDPRTQRVIHRILGATFAPFAIVPDTAAAARSLEESPPLLVIADHRLLTDEVGHHILASARDGTGPPCLVLAEEHDGAALDSLLVGGALSNLLANPMPLLAEELTATALKLLRGDLWGLEKYMAWGVVSRSRELREEDRRDLLVADLADDVAAAGLGPRLAQKARLIADELLSNACRCGGAATLRYACDGRYLAVEVSDHGGNLERSTIARALGKAVGRAPGKVDRTGRGAGIGLATVYMASNHLVFNVAPGRRTEIIALVDTRFRPAEIGARVPSLGVFWDWSSS
jgi:anti-sigma regulatory factor (Ser/Thr protein kinase)